MDEKAILSLDSKTAPVFLAAYLTPGRIQHVLQVAEMANVLALHWQIDSRKAWLAGILHDICKSMSPETFKTQGIPLSNPLKRLFRHYPKVWHAFAALPYLDHCFHFQDRDILNAIQWHTTGKRDLSPLDQIVFIADYIEPGRPFRHRAWIETLAYQSLEAATYVVSNFSCIHLLIRHEQIHPATLRCRSFFQKKLTLDLQKTLSKGFDALHEAL